MMTLIARLKDRHTTWPALLLLATAWTPRLLSMVSYMRGVLTQACNTGFSVYLCLLLTPLLQAIGAYFPQAAPVVAAVVWVRDTGAHAFGAFSFFMTITLLLSLGNDVRKRLERLYTHRASSTIGPLSLEDGTADEHIHAPIPAAESKHTLLIKVVALFLFAAFFTSRCFLDDRLSLNKPVLDNIRAAGLYVLHGLVNLSVLGSMLLLVALVQYKHPVAQVDGEVSGLSVVAEASPMEEMEEQGEKALLVQVEV
ncbi:hypothetical protein C8R47DRAFT_141835 [Mycena vitilis]|nr:hypothetical protein C8R47DRAFT_141835 [Mycena vitilis]